MYFYSLISKTLETRKEKEWSQWAVEHILINPTHFHDSFLVWQHYLQSNVVTPRQTFKAFPELRLKHIPLHISQLGHIKIFAISETYHRPSCFQIFDHIFFHPEPLFNPFLLHSYYIYSSFKSTRMDLNVTSFINLPG